MASVSPFSPGRKSTPVLDAALTAIRDDILASVRGEHAREVASLQREIALLATQVRDLVGRKIEVASAPAPNVTVNPQVHVASPEVFPPDVAVTVDLKDLAALLRETNGLLRQPVTRTVTRGSDGYIVSVHEKRG